MAKQNSIETAVSKAQNPQRKNHNNKVQSERPAFGTKEWADNNFNCFLGCSNDCKYCYAKAMAIRFKRKTPETWKEEVLVINKVNKKFQKRKGTILFPSSHDITPTTLDASLVVLKKLLKAENEVLIVSKPHLEVIKVLCEELREFQSQILFRFTIGSANTETLKFWEPGAPSFEERLASTIYAFTKGFKTSLSIEPCLDLEPEKVIESARGYITNDAWIGLPNMLIQRLSTNGHVDPKTIIKAKELTKSQNKKWLNEIVKRYANEPDVKWKESVKRKLN